MKKLLIPTLTITALISMSSCDMNKRTAYLEDNNLSESSDNVRTSASSTATYGDSAGSAAAGNATYRRIAHPVVTESDEFIFTEDADYDEFERQAMEETDYRPYPVERYEREEDRLNRLQKENGIFYGYPSATGASGSPGSYELTK